MTVEPRMTNHAVSVHCAGLVVDDDDIVHYASLIGNAQALKSIYATLIKGTKELRAPGYNWSDLRGKRPYRSWSKKLPNTTYTCAVSKPVGQIKRYR